MRKCIKSDNVIIRNNSYIGKNSSIAGKNLMLEDNRIINDKTKIIANDIFIEVILTDSLVMNDVKPIFCSGITSLNEQRAYVKKVKELLNFEKDVKIKDGLQKVATVSVQKDIKS